MIFRVSLGICFLLSAMNIIHASHAGKNVAQDVRGLNLGALCYWRYNDEDNANDGNEEGSNYNYKWT
jgi:hypothetical protein